MQLLVEQLERRIVELGRWLVCDRTEVADVPEAPAGGAWQAPLNTSVWLQFTLRRPDAWPVEDTALVAERFGTHPLDSNQRIGRDLQRMQGMLYVNGQPYHGLDQYHRLIYLPAGPDYACKANIWTGFAELDFQPNPT